MLLGNIGQQLDIGDLDNAIGGMRDELEQTQALDQEQGRDIEQLRKENREMKLYLATLLRLLAAKGVLKPEEIDATVRAIETN